jgi:hypothetical protein
MLSRAVSGSRCARESGRPAASRRSVRRLRARGTAHCPPPRSRPRARSRRSTRPRDSRPARRSRLRPGSRGFESEPPRNLTSSNRGSDPLTIAGPGPAQDAAESALRPTPVTLLRRGLTPNQTLREPRPTAAGAGLRPAGGSLRTGGHPKHTTTGRLLKPPEVSRRPGGGGSRGNHGFPRALRSS